MKTGKKCKFLLDNTKEKVQRRKNKILLVYIIYFSQMSGFFNMKHHVWSKPWHITLDITSVFVFLQFSKTYLNKSYNEHILQYSKNISVKYKQIRLISFYWAIEFMNLWKNAMHINWHDNATIVHLI